jgi:hypothetical protein
LLSEPTDNKTFKNLNSAAPISLCEPGYFESIPQFSFYKVCDIIIIIIIIIIEAPGTISKSFRKYVSSIPGNHEVRELQKTAVLGTAHILRKVLT